VSIDTWEIRDSSLDQARTLIGLGRYADAAAILARLAASQPGDPETWCLLSAAQLGNAQPDVALASAQYAAGLAPDANWPQRLRSRALWQLERYEEAAEAARLSVSLAPDEPAGYIALAQALAKISGRASEAGAAAQRAVALAPDSPAAHFVAGVAEAAAGHRDQAERAFRRALEIDANHTASMNELARLQWRSGPTHLVGASGLADAASGFANAVRTDPRAHSSRYNLDLALRAFLGRTSYLIFLVALLAAYWGPKSTSGLHRAAPIALLIPAVFATRFLARLPRELRRHMLGLLGQALLRIAALTEALAVTALIASSVITHGPRAALIGFALCAALVARIAIQISAFRLRGPRPRRRVRPRSIRQLVGLVVVSLLLVRVALGVAFSPAVRAWLHIGSQLPDCTAAGISTAAAREGTCVRNVDLFGNGTTYTVVNRARTLRMPGYNARLIDERIREIPVAGPNVNATDYPGNIGLMVAYKLAITNTASQPLTFDTTGSDANLVIPNQSGTEIEIDEDLNGPDPASPTFTGRMALPPHTTMTGWVNFITPLWASATLAVRPADLQLFLPGQSHDDYVGQIRLWH
jgi:tetratricopeptide (TPR) repeat protein